MLSDKKTYVSILTLTAFLSVFAAGCGQEKNGTVQAEECFIYTDGLLDDLCAIEYLGEKYDHAVIMVMDPEGIAGNQYASEKVQDESALMNEASKWFEGIEAYQDDTDLSKADLYLFAPLTDFAELLKEDPSLSNRHAVLMAGDYDGPQGAGEEWNAVKDNDAYRYVTSNMKDLIQMTRFECEAEYMTGDYPFQAEFLDEYVSKMKTINENVCCYDLQAAAFAFK